MTTSRSLVLALALCAAGPALIFPATASHAAEDAAEVGTTLAILPVGSADGDGTKLTLHVLALDGSGAGITGLDLKPGATLGAAADWKEEGEGRYSFTYTTTDVNKPTEVTLSVKGKLASKEAVEAETVVLLRPSDTLTATADPSELVLGKTTEASLKVTNGPAKGDLIARASAGEVTNMTNMGGGKYTARYEAPKVNFPHLAIVTLADASNPDGSYGFHVIKLQGAVDYPIEATPNASVLLKVGDREFGPEKVGADGKATVPIMVPPGVSEATQVTVIDGESKEKTLDLRVPETKRLAAFPMARSVPADSGITVPVRVLVLEGTGGPDEEATVKISADQGSVGPVTHAGGGVYEASWTPADADKAGTAILDFQLDGSSVHVEQMEVKTVPRRAVDLQVATEDTPTGSIKLMVAASGSNGKPLSGSKLYAKAAGGGVTAPPNDASGGVYTVEVEKDTTSVGLILAGPASKNPVRHVLVLPEKSSVDADGASTTDLVLVAVDAYGAGVADVEISLEATGGAKVPAKAKTDGRGLVRGVFTAGSEVGVVEVVASAGDARGAAALLQGLEGDVPTSGSEAGQAMYAGWEGVVVRHQLGAEEGPAVATVAAAPPMPEVELGDPEAEATQVEVSFFPEEVGPGGVVTVRAIPMDADGKALPGKTLDVLTSNGAVGDTEETTGVYDTEVTIGEDAEGEAKISVGTPSGVMKLVKVPVNAELAVADADEPASAWGSTEGDEPEEEPEEEKPPKEKKPAEPVDSPWLMARASGVVSAYSYDQSPESDPGPLLPSSLTVGGDSAPAIPRGGEIAARVWVPDLPYVGGVANVRASYYAIATAAFSEPAPDWLYDINVMATGRYPVQVDGSEFWLGAKAGFHYDDFMMFQGCLEPGCQVTFEPLSLAGLGVGAEMGANIGSVYFIGGYQHNLAGATVPYGSNIDASVGYIYENVLFDLGFSWVNRSVALLGVDSGDVRGQLADTQLMGKLGAGVAF